MKPPEQKRSRDANDEEQRIADHPEGSRKKDDAVRRYSAFARYSGMAVQFFLIVGIAAWGGQKLDAHFNTPRPYITAFLVVFFAVGYFYKMYIDLTK